MISLRRAEAADVEGIATVIRDVWEQDVLETVCRAQIEDDASALWVAAEDGEVAGFVSAFVTVAGVGPRRWEVDLIAVRRASQDRGLGTRLIRHVCKAGHARAISLTRALIQAENGPSQRAFRNAGFTATGRPGRLLLWPPGSGPDNAYTGPVALLPVDTLTYRGLWLEGLTSVCAEEQRRAVKAARSIVFEENRANAGAVVPVDESHLLAPDLGSQAHVHGEYHWFVKRQ
jgi:N-acetylglutamate synthase-like GNAT family acetyltransferase